MAWIEERNGAFRTVWEPPASSGLGRQSLTWPKREDAEVAKLKINARKNNISMEAAYTLVTGREFPAAQVDPVGPLMRDWADGWLDRRQVTEGTRNTYRRQLDKVILPRLGDLPVSKISYTHIEDMLADLRDKKGLSGRTVTRYFALVHAILNSAVRSLEVPITVNPAIYLDFKRDRIDNTDTGENTDAEDYLEVWEYKLILENMHPDSRTLIQFLAETGARIGEALALQVRDVDKIGGTVQIRRAWKADMKGGSQLGPTKNRGRRTLTTPDDLLTQLTALCKGRVPNDFVFRSPRGKVWPQNNFFKRRWVPAVEAASRCKDHDGPCECPNVLRRAKRPHIHLLRHSYATWMLFEGRSSAEVAGDLGHSSVQMIETTYGHAIRKRDSRRVTALDRIMARGA